MFDFIQKHRRVAQIFLALIGITFATWGIESYTRVRGGSDNAATVNGTPVSQREFEAELRRQQERQQDQFRRMFGRPLEAESLDTPQIRKALLDQLIAVRLATQGLTVPDEVLAEILSSDPAFQLEGKFSRAQYETMLRSQNPPMSPREYEARLRQLLALRQTASAVADSAIVAHAVSERLATLENEKREVSQSPITAEQFMGQAKVEDAEVKAYFDAHQAEFVSPERVRAEYVVLSADALAADEKVSAEDVKAAWEGAFGQKAKERKEARKKALAVLAEVKKDPARFAEIAKAESQDPGSKEHGGDLGFTGRGSFVKPFEDALYKMKPGAISGLVESEFGFHIIQLTGVQKKDGKEERRASHILISAPDAGKPFEQMRAQLETELKKSRAAKRFNESAEAFGNLVYEQPDSLKPAAERFKLQVRTSPWIAKGVNQDLGPLDNAKLLAALFSQDSIKSRRNTDAIEVAPGQLVSARVIEYQPAGQRSFDEAKGEIAAKLKKQKAVALAQKDGAARLEQLRKGGAVAVKWGPTRNVSRRDAQGLPREFLEPIVTADTSKLPAYVGIPVSDAGYLLVRITKVTEADAKEKGVDGGTRAAMVAGGAQYDAYLASMRGRADVEIKPEALEKKAQ
ncbi:MAG TPA: SurA N-terminal domain-containing protein [Burkholderiales bacterium]|nr:SurA N-terminal domain-containing protein [Burkholderiales bacterium]